jgi:hypothetical protein
MSWTGGKDMIDRATKRYSYHYQCNRKNRKKFTTVCPVVPIPADGIEKYVIEFVKKLLNNPQATFEYQRSLDSSRLNIKRLRKQRETYQGLLDSLPQRKINILKQHELGAFDNLELQKRLEEIKVNETNSNKEIDKIDFEISKESLSKGYEASLELYAQKYGQTIEKLFIEAETNEEAKKELHDLIHMLIDRVIVYARPRTEKDSIAGRKKENQLIPDKIDIQLNLPQNLLQELITQKFGARNTNL